MFWWVNLYLISLSLLTIANIFQQRKMGHAMWYITVSLFSVTILVFGVLSYFVGSVSEFTGRALLPLLLASLAWGIYQTKIDLRNMDQPSDMADMENKIIRVVAVLISIIFWLPAFLAGIIVGVEKWSFLTR